jgi:hypothetical protein
MQTETVMRSGIPTLINCEDRRLDDVSADEVEAAEKAAAEAATKAAADAAIKAAAEKASKVTQAEAPAPSVGPAKPKSKAK